MQQNRQTRSPFRLALMTAAIALLFVFATRLNAEPSPSKPSTAASTSSASPAASQPVANDRAAQTSADDDRLEFMIHDDRNASADQPSSIGMMARALGALLLVIGLLVASAWCLRRLKGTPLGGAREDAQLAVLTTVSIGDKRSLTVVRFGQRTLLLGSTQQSVTLLAADDDDDLLPVESSARSVAEVLSASEADPHTAPPSFAAELNRQEQGQWRYQATEDRLDKSTQVDNWR
jgi:flagellar biosynthetic protein FliO